MALTATKNATITKDAKGAFYTALSARKPSIPVGQFISAETVDASSKDFGWFGMPSFPREWNGPRAHKAIVSYTDNLVPKKWENTLDVNRELVEDDQTMQAQLPRIGAALAERNQEHLVKRFTEVLEAGTGTTIDNSWDGASTSFFSSTHSFHNSGTVDNSFTSAAATGTDPTASEFETAYGDAIEAMIAFPNDQGDPAGAAGAMGFVAMVPPSYLKAAATVLGPNASLNGGGTTEGDVTGVTGVFRGATGGYIVNPYLTNADRFYVLRAGLPGAVGPFIFQRHSGAPWEIDLTEDKENDTYCFRTRARYEVHYGDFLAAGVHIFT